MIWFCQIKLFEPDPELDPRLFVIDCPADLDEAVHRANTIIGVLRIVARR